MKIKGENKFFVIQNSKLSSGTLYEDPNFPYTVDPSIIWLRPTNSPVFITNHHPLDRFNVNRSKYTFPNMALVLSVLSRDNRIFEYVIPEDQGYTKGEYAGMFRFRFWTFGRWQSVIVDDRLPYNKVDMCPRYASFSNSPDLWCSLLEKAYAKFVGGYHTIGKINIVDMLQDICGDIGELINVKNQMKNHLQEILTHGIPNQCVVVAIKSHTGNEIDSLDSENDPYYWVNEIVEIKKQKIIHLVNPYGLKQFDNNYEPFGYYGEDELLPKNRSIEMNIDTFRRTFDYLAICSPRNSFDIVRNDSSGKWHLMDLNGVLVNPQMEIRNSRYDYNCQFHIQLRSPDVDDPKRLCTLIVSLVQNYSRPLASIALKIYEADHLRERIPKFETNFFKTSEPIAQTNFYERRSVVLRLRLHPGRYIIVPLTNKESQKFLMSIISPRPVRLVLPFIQYGMNFIEPVSIKVSAPSSIVLGSTIYFNAKVKNPLPDKTFKVTIFMTISHKLESEILTLKAKQHTFHLMENSENSFMVKANFFNYTPFPNDTCEILKAQAEAYVHETNRVVDDYCLIQVLPPVLHLFSPSNFILNKQRHSVDIRFESKLPLFLRDNEVLLKLDDKEITHYIEKPIGGHTTTSIQTTVKLVEKSVALLFVKYKCDKLELQSDWQLQLENDRHTIKKLYHHSGSTAYSVNRMENFNFSSDDPENEINHSMKH